MWTLKNLKRILLKKYEIRKSVGSSYNSPLKVEFSNAVCFLYYQIDGADKTIIF